LTGSLRDAAARQTSAGYRLADLAARRTSGPGSLIGRQPAQRLARHELAKLAALPLWYRILQDIGQLFGYAGSAVPVGWFGLIALAVLAIVLVIVIVVWVRPARKRRAAAGAVLGGRARTAREYRDQAARLAATGEYGQAIIEGVRAIAAELDERAILLPRPGRTANELAAEAGRELPALTTDLRTVTRLFDDVRYGGRPGTQAGYALVTRVDAQARTAEPHLAGSGQVQDSQLAVPR
jgi:type II secretory pathway pseudopilin PulG